MDITPADAGWRSDAYPYSFLLLLYRRSLFFVQHDKTRLETMEDMRFSQRYSCRLLVTE